MTKPWLTLKICKHQPTSWTPLPRILNKHQERRSVVFQSTWMIIVLTQYRLLNILTKCITHLTTSKIMIVKSN
jgi:hypothetical protein